MYKYLVVLYKMEKPKDGITVYTKSNCLYCTKMKEIFPNAHYINCDSYLEDTDEFLDFLDTLTDKQPTKFPMVFNDKKYIGGFDEAQDKLLQFDADF